MQGQGDPEKFRKGGQDALAGIIIQFILLRPILKKILNTKFQGV